MARGGGGRATVDCQYGAEDVGMNAMLGRGPNPRTGAVTFTACLPSSRGRHEEASGSFVTWRSQVQSDPTVHDVRAASMLTITEALLEMHFHRALVDLFQATYGAKFL